MSPVKFPNDEDITYHFVGWHEYGKLATQLSHRILEANQKPFDRIIPLATGGLTLGRAMKDYLGVEKISTVQISFYTDIGESTDNPTVIQSLPINIKGENILVFDDINDTGKTLNVATQYLSESGAGEITTATIFQKPHTAHPSDYYQQETKSWIIFPDEIRETITLLGKRWGSKGAEESEIKARLIQIGFKSNHIDTFLHRL